MSRLSCNELTTYRWSFEDDVINYRRLGFAGIGVWRQKLSDFGEERGVDLLHESGLSVSNVLWAGGFTGSDGRSFRESIVDALDAIQLAASLRADCLVLYTGARGGHTNKHARRLVNDAIKELLPAAEESNLCLAIEPIPASFAANCTFLTDFDQALELVGKYRHSHLKLVLDTYFFGGDAELIERLPEIVSQIAVVHLGDGRPAAGPEQDRTGIGQGMLPLGQIVQTLEAANYSGWYDLELVGQDIETSNYAELLSRSKHAFDYLLQAVQVD